MRRLTAAACRIIGLGVLLFVVGHMMLDAASQYTIKPAVWELPVMAALVGLAFSAGMLMAAFPLSLILPVLVVLAYAIMVQDRSQDTSPFMVGLSNARGTVLGYMIYALIPIIAVLTGAVLKTADIQLESCALHIIWAGPVSIGLIAWSAVRILRTRCCASLR